MPDMIDIDEFEERFDELIERAERGETIVFVRHGEPILEMVPYHDEGSKPA